MMTPSTPVCVVSMPRRRMGGVEVQVFGEGDAFELAS